MNALLVSNSPESADNIINLMSTNFKNITFTRATTPEAAVDEILCGEKIFIFTIVDIHNKDETVKHTFMELTDVLEDYPIIFYGQEKKLISLVPPSIMGVNPSNGTISTPTDVLLFIETINKALKWVNDIEQREQEIELDLNECLAIKIKNFYRFKKMSYDVYLEVTYGKFIKIITAGEDYSSSLIQRYTRKGVKLLYLKKEAHIKLLDEAIMESILIFQGPELPVKDQLLGQIRACAIIHEYIRTIGICANIIQLSEKVVEVTSSVYHSLGNIFNVIKEFPFRDRDLSEKSILTSYLCEGIVLKMGWSSDMSKVKLGLASIIHDCMLSNEDMTKITSLDDPNLAMFTKEEQDEYEQHPKVAAAVAQHFSGHPEVDFVIAQHHELPNGKGFPQRLNSHQITVLSCIFILANKFVGELSQKKISKASVKKVCDEFDKIYSIGNFRKPLAALRSLFNL